jgi:uncharacterized protein
MEHYVLIYYMNDDFVERRTPFRPEHLRLVQEAHDRGELLMAGPVGDPIRRAFLVFRGPNASTAEAFAQTDPYVKNRLITRWEVEPWTVVVGGQP